MTQTKRPPTIPGQFSQNKEFEIVDTHATEILPDVFVSAGDFFKYGMIRVAIDAPKEIEILRGDRYRSKDAVRGK